MAKILVIEDNEADATIALRAFTRARIANRLRVVSSAEEALQYLQGTGVYSESGPTRPEMILLDLNLPQMSGLEFLRRVKSDEAAREIPVVVMTVSQSDKMIIECSRLGAEHYIIKPLAFESFVRVTPKLNLNLTLGSAPELSARSRTF